MNSTSFGSAASGDAPPGRPRGGSAGAVGSTLRPPVLALALVGGLLLFGLGGCGDAAEAPHSADPVETASTEPVAFRDGQGASDPPAALSTAPSSRHRFWFEPDKGDDTDVAVGEIHRYVVRLHAAGNGAPPPVRLVSSCDCLSARFLTPLTPEGADVEIEVNGHREEDIDGVITLEDGERTELAEYATRILIQPKLFVMPREVVLRGEQSRFEVGVYQAFPKDKTDAEIYPEDILGNEDLLGMTDLHLVDKLELNYLLKGFRLEYELTEAARTSTWQETIRILMPEPAGELTLPVRRAE